MKKKVMIDMDGVLCEYLGAHEEALKNNPRQNYPQSQFGFYLNLEPIPSALFAVEQLKDKYDVWILTKPSYRNINSYTEKALWIQNHLGTDMVDKLIMSPDKSLVKGDYLIDDMDNAGQLEFEGELLRFGKGKEFPTWICVLDYLMQ